jgi:hypothetical protein
VLTNSDGIIALMYYTVLSLHILVGALSIFLSPLFIRKIIKNENTLLVKKILKLSAFTTVSTGFSLIIFGANIAKVCLVLSIFSILITVVIVYGEQTVSYIDSIKK